MFRSLFLRGAVLAFALASIAKADPVRDTLDKGWNEKGAGHYEEALKLFESVIAKDPKNFEALGARGATLVDMGRDQDALPDLEKAAQLAINEPWYPKVLAIAYSNLGNLDKAASASREAIRMGSKEAAPHAILGKCFAAQKEWKEAEAELSLAIDISPDYAWALGQMAELQANEGHNGLAFLYYHEALRVAPKDSSRVADLAELCVWSLGRLDEGIDLAKQGAQLDAKGVRFPEILEEAYRQKGMTKEAVEAGRTAVSVGPQFSRTHFFLARALHAAKQDDEAKKEMKKAIELEAALASDPGAKEVLGTP